MLTPLTNFYFLLGLGLLCIVSLGHQRFTSSTLGLQNTHSDIGSTFSWDKLPSLKYLQWTACYDVHECARLSVPLNYSDPDGRQASIALLRKPAAVPRDSEFYRGPILVNPGGPGASGVDMVIGWGGRFSQIVGPQFDFVGFDPRGVARSTPGIRFFKSEAEAAFWWKDTPTLITSSEKIARPWAQGQLLSQLAVESDDGYLQHINAENTARDMLRIVEAYGREKLQYWGFSYGTVLGMTFATLFPVGQLGQGRVVFHQLIFLQDKVERVVIDGVVDIDDFFRGRYLTGFQDIDKALKSFFTGCADAGPLSCPFWAPTADDIERNLTAISDSLRNKPIPVHTKQGYGLLDYATLHNFIGSALYKPQALFSLLAQGLADLAKGNASTLFDLTNTGVFECKCSQVDAVSGQLREANIAIHCNDGGDYLGDLESAEAYYKQIVAATSWGDGWVMRRFFCGSWPKFDNRILDGPVNVSTSHPILLVGTTADPVTPLQHAKKMSPYFNGSIVLAQNSAGHSTISAPSVCTQKYIRDYFVDGSLPPPDTVCHPDTLPFPPADLPSPHKQTTFGASFTSEEWEIFTAVHAMSLDQKGPVSKLSWSI